MTDPHEAHSHASPPPVSLTPARSGSTARALGESAPGGPALIQAYLEHIATRLARAGFAPRTVVLYTARIRHLATDLGRPPVHVSPAELNAYLARQARRPGPSRRAVIQTHSALRRVLLDLHDRRDLAEVLLRPPLPPAGAVRILTPEETHRVFRAFDSNRDRTLAGLIWGAGLRASEAVRLRVIDIRTTLRRIEVPERGTLPSRRVRVPAWLVPGLREACLGKLPQAWLFPGAGIGPLGVRAFQKRLRLASDRSGVAEVTPTVLRRSGEVWRGDRQA